MTQKACCRYWRFTMESIIKLVSRCLLWICLMTKCIQIWIYPAFNGCCSQSDFLLPIFESRLRPLTLLADWLVGIVLMYFACVCVSVSLLVCVCVRVCLYVLMVGGIMCACVLAHVCVCVCVKLLRVCVSVCMYVYTCVHVRVCVRVCVYDTQYYLHTIISDDQKLNLHLK